MHKILIIKAFEKAKSDLTNQGIQNPSKVKLAEEISDCVENIEGFSLGERSYRDYYKGALQIEEEALEDIEINQIRIINGLCTYLGFTNYSEFTNSIGDKKKNKKLPPFKSNFKKYRVYIIILSLVAAFVIYSSINKQRWMVWQTDHYIEADFNTKLLNEGVLKIYNLDRITDFRKASPDCQTDFFKEDGTEKLWYGKNKSGELEFFTSLGLHPETGKTLKKITDHMIKKYICPDY
ncbi:hypothetical protein [Bizionia arctica]|uniref:Uncharacterized protein n=1 Tax=Bizionia arctica TaxID=1495645 RepID=A0A917GP30_9FLAO|nr:hypothetical protein [Bizionia arctica]GGG52340.1 hypothetical protein GCM10010976_24350 [Bizionia arctica]